jgi:hypothetical protein
MGEGGDAAREEGEAQWRGLWRGYTEFYETQLPEEISAATWRRIVAPKPAIPRRFAEQEARLLRILPFAAARGNLRSRAHMLSGGSVRRSRRAAVAGFGAWQAPRGEGPDLANRAV